MCSGALAADASAGAGDEKGTTGLEIVSQELVPASQALQLGLPRRVRQLEISLQANRKRDRIQIHQFRMDLGKT